MKNKVINKPLVSVLMPVFNTAKYLPQAVKSVLSQTYTNFELIMIDDGSRDDSWVIMQKFAKKDKRVKIFKNDINSGIGYTRKRLASLARGKYAAIMDSDDIMFPDRLKVQVAFLQNNPSVVVVGGQCVTIDELGNESGYKSFPLTHEDIYKMMFTRMSVQQPASMINLVLVPKDFPWYDNSVSPVEDLDNLFRLFNSGKFANIQDNILYYRVYPASNSLKNIKRTFWLTMKVRARAVINYGYHPTVPAWLVMIPQMLAVMILPAKYVFPVYAFLRGIKRAGMEKIVQPIFAWVNARA